MKFCHDCGASIALHVGDFCPNCGALVPDLRNKSNRTSLYLFAVHRINGSKTCSCQIRYGGKVLAHDIANSDVQAIYLAACQLAGKDPVD